MPLSVSETSLVTNAYPVQIGNSEIVLQDELGNSDLSEVEEYSCINREVVNLENADVNINNSNDVIIGPVTQFNVNGNVTIYQNGQSQNEAINETVTQEPQIDLKSANDDSKSKDAVLEHCFHILYKNKNHIRNLGIILLVILICLIIALIFLEKYKQKEEEYDYDYKENDYGSHLGIHKVYYRKDWDGKPPKYNTVPLKHPISLVIISHSATRTCDSFKECAMLVKKIQTDHFSKPTLSRDIGYNFLIGGDGNIYVGRSWDIQNFHRKISIGISFIGDFNFDEFTPDMIDAAKLLISQGLELNKLPHDYILVGENQTNSKMYLSPGVNVYKVIKNWPHFFNNTML